MHRSGSSAVTRVVNLLGADITRELIPARPDNIRGYWESSEVVRIHDHLLHALGSASDDPCPLPAHWLEHRVAQEAKLELAGAITGEFGNSSLFVVKDPRISRLLPLWLELLDELDIEAAVIVPFRNPLEVAASLERRDGLSLTKSLLLYVYSYLATELASRGRLRCFVRYDRVLGDWRLLERKIRDLLGSRLPPASQEHSVEIERFLTPDLYHHRHSREDLAGLSDVPGIVVDLFDRMNDAADGVEDTALLGPFDDLRAAADAAAKMFRGMIIDEREMMRAELAQLRLSASWRLTAPLRWMNHHRGRLGRLLGPWDDSGKILG